MIEHLEALERGDINKLAMILPPRHTKTTLGSILLPAYVLGRNPTETCITVSYGADLSETWGRRVRNIFGDPAYQQLYPNSKLSPDSAASYRFTTTAGGEYNATGRGGPITGKGASLLVLDDLVKDSSEANSDTITRGIIEWLQSVAFTRLTPKGRALAISTRWGERDPMGWIMSQPGWTILHLPAIAESDNDPLGRKVGEALWPSQYSADTLKQTRIDIGSRVFECLYQGNVAAASGTIFKRDWFRHYDQAPGLESFFRIVQSWDTAFKTGATNDYSVCATFGESKNGFYLLSLYRGKIEFPELKRKVSELADFWKPSEIYIEDRASGQSLISELKIATTYPVIPVKADHDKETRASACTGFFEAGKILFPRDAAWLPDLEDELASFPGGRFDDCVDAICQTLNRLRGTGESLTLVKVIKEMAVTASSVGTPPRHGPQDGDECPNPNCKSTATRVMSGGEGERYLHCNQCSCDNGVTVVPADTRCPNYPDGKHRMAPAGGAMRCNGCGYTPDLRAVQSYNGIDRKQYESGRGRWGRMGQFALSNPREGPGILGGNDGTDRIDAMVNRTIFGRLG
jgi:predicted phage terminase large subunit-like protein